MTNKIITDNKFLSDKSKNFIENFILTNKCPFYVQHEAVGGDNTKNLTHTVLPREEYREKNYEPHIYYDYFVDILSDFCSKHDIKFYEILRIAINISYYNGVTDKSPVHTDHEFDHNQLLVYLNDPLDKESKTVLLDNNNDVYKEFYPEKYKGVMFSKMPHYVIYPRVGERYILVFTFR